MLLPFLFAVGMAGAQAAPAASPALPPVGPGRFFLSPMGEPFYGRTAGEDGLVVWFEQADRNHDGAITSDEMAADADQFFAILDRQHDGEIDPDDMTYYEGVLAPQVRVRSIISSRVLPGGEREEDVDDESASGLNGLLKIPQPVASADRNFNRGVSPEEFRSAAQRRFQMLDAAGTGRLTLAQLRDIRRAAGTVAKRGPEMKPGESDDPHSAEYGRPQRF